MKVQGHATDCGCNTCYPPEECYREALAANDYLLSYPWASGRVVGEMVKQADLKRTITNLRRRGVNMIVIARIR